MIYALICINNHIFSCLISMLSRCSGDRREGNTCMREKGERTTSEREEGSKCARERGEGSTRGKRKV